MNNCRSSLRIHNVANGAIINLVFEGNLRKLTGAQLRQHIEKICSIPAWQQLLTFNGFPVKDTSTGATVGLHDKAMLELRTISDDVRKNTCGGDANKTTTTTAAAAKRRAAGSRSGGFYASDEVRQNAKGAEEHLNRSLRGEAFGGREIFPRLCVTSAAEKERRCQATSGGHTPQTPTPFTGQSGLSLKSQTYTIFPLERGESLGCLTEPVDVVIEEEPIEEINNTDMISMYDIDLEELRLEEREYIWLVDQMQFETERMCRERELMREREELECEANMLERQREILGQYTLRERRKISELERWTREEEELEAYLLNNVHHKNGVCNDVNNFDTAVELIQKN